MESPDRWPTTHQDDGSLLRGTGSGAWRLNLLDGLRLTRARQLIPITSRGQRLTALLALRGPQTRTMIGGMLWPEVSEARARTSVRAAVRDLNLQAPGLLVSTAFDVRLDPAIPIDVQTFMAQARQLLQGGPSLDAGARPIDLPDALELTPGGALGGRLLPGWQDDWVVAEAERLHQLRLHALDALVHQLVQLTDYAVALQVALAAVSIDPLRESTHRTAMQVHLAEGNTVEALRQYERFRTTLRAAMNIEPSRRMLDLVNEILRSGSPDPVLSIVAVQS
jgi:DNA-binding SARP family transcriptional activator